MTDDPRLPDFEHPPVVETVMAVRFRELPGFTSARVGQFWERHLIDELPASEDRPPYAAPVERFGSDWGSFELQLKLSEVPPPTRSWFVGGNNVVQLQSDWFAWNWRKTEEEPDYIRYDRGRERFERWFTQLERFVVEEIKSHLVPIQCEITYVNQIELTEDDLTIGPLGNVIRGARPSAGDFLPSPDGAQAVWSYIMPNTENGVGRLHLSAVSTADRSTGARGIRLMFTARGRPRQESLSGTLAFFDQGHEWIVRGFKDATTDTMWDRWGLRRDSNAPS